MFFLQISVESIPWIQIFWGLFISGILLTLLSLLSGFGEHDVSADHDVGVDHDVSVDHDVGLSHDVGVGHDVGDIHADITAGHEGIIESSAGAPFMLLFGGFLLIYGALGVIMFSSVGLVLEKLFVMTVITFLALWLLNFSWRKVFKGVTYEIPTQSRLVGKTAIVVHTVDKDGGTIKVNIGGPKGVMKFPAVPKSKEKTFKPGTRVVIEDWFGSTAVVEEYSW